MHNEHVVSVGKAGARKDLPDTLLGFETTSPRVCCVGGRCRLLASSSLWGLGVLVVAPLWWWGVVFDLWIVVASIEMVACVKGCLPVWGVVSLCGLSFHVMQIFLIPACRSAFRGGVCVGDSFFGFVL